MEPVWLWGEATGGGSAGKLVCFVGEAILTGDASAGLLISRDTSPEALSTRVPSPAEDPSRGDRQVASTAISAPEAVASDRSPEREMSAFKASAAAVYLAR